MKRKTTILTYMRPLLAAMLVSLLSLSMITNVWAEEEEFTWNSSVFHLSDPNDVVDDDAMYQENKDNEIQIQEQEFDFACILTVDAMVKGNDLPIYLEEIYTKNDLGYGANRDGIFLGINTDTNEMCFYLSGRAKEILTRTDVDDLADEVRLGYADNGYLGAIHTYRMLAAQMVEESGTKAEAARTYDDPAFVISTVPLESADRATAIMVDGVLMPSWFEVDETFVNFQNEGTEPRVIDNADLLTHGQEEVLNRKLMEIRDLTGEDIVLLTDNTSYGLDNELYEMSFYIYNGYGIGEDCDGLMCFINMDPDNREMCSTAFGSMETSFTQRESSRLDDILYDHLVAGDYFNGFVEWADGVEKLLRFGTVDVADWYVQYVDGNLPENASAQKIVDTLGVLSEEDLASLNKSIDEITEKYGLDIVVFIGDEAMPTAADQTDEERVESYLTLFYETYGYDTGARGGVILGILTRENSTNTTTVLSFGGASRKFTEKICRKLDGRALINLGSGEYKDNIDRYLSSTRSFLRTGYVPKSLFFKIVCVIAAFLCGTYVAYYRTENRKKKNQAAKIAKTAELHLVAESFKVTYQNDVLLYVSEEKKRIEVDTSPSSSSSSSSSRSSSSYGSSSHSAGGHSGTTSRRKF